MKKLISLLVLVFVVGTAGFSQYTIPRFGTTTNQDNTGRVLTYKYKNVTDAVGNDSITITPSAWFTIYRVALTDSIRFNSPKTSLSYAGDNIRIVASGASGTKVTFAGVINSRPSKFIFQIPTGATFTTGSLILGTKGRGVIQFTFDGVYWVETSRLAY